MRLITKIITIAVACASIVSASRHLSAARPNEISVHYLGTAVTGGSSQVKIIDTGAANVFVGGAIIGSNNCTVIFNVSGSGNAITGPVITCANSCSVTINILGNVNTLTTTTITCLEGGEVELNVYGSLNTLTGATVTSSGFSSSSLSFVGT